MFVKILKLISSHKYVSQDHEISSMSQVGKTLVSDIKYYKIWICGGFHFDGELLESKPKTGLTTLGEQKVALCVKRDIHSLQHCRLGTPEKVRSSVPGHTSKKFQGNFIHSSKFQETFQMHIRRIMDEQAIAQSHNGKLQSKKNKWPRTSNNTGETHEVEGSSKSQQTM